MAAPAETIARLVARVYAPEQVSERLKRIHEDLMRGSSRLRENFVEIAPADMALLFDLYDREFFENDLSALLRQCGAPLQFLLSSRLTRSAGMTKRYSVRAKRGQPPQPPTRFEILLSPTLLFQTFRDVEREVRVNGLVCHNRLEAAQRIFEHELMHLLEMLLWDQSSCSADRYRALVWNYFNHPETRHDLVTQTERAREKFDVKPGDRVRFEFEGKEYLGLVNRITKRATVLVESATGQLYADGKRYLKWYIPLANLEKVEK
jgi:hypothetical protein